MYLHLKDGVLTFSSGIMHEFKVLLKFLCHDEDDMLTSVTLLQNFTQWSSIFSERLFLFFGTHTPTPWLTPFLVLGKSRVNQKSR